MPELQDSSDTDGEDEVSDCSRGLGEFTADSDSDDNAMVEFMGPSREQQAKMKKEASREAQEWDGHYCGSRSEDN